MKIRFVVSFHETAWKSFLDIFVRHFSLGIFSPQRKCRLWSEKTDNRCSPLPRTTRRRAARSAGSSSFSSSRPSSSSFRSLLLLPRTTSTTNERHHHHHHHHHRHRSTRRHSSTPSLPEGRKRDERSARKSPTSGSGSTGRQRCANG